MIIAFVKLLWLSRFAGIFVFGRYVDDTQSGNCDTSDGILGTARSVQVARIQLKFYTHGRLAHLC
jgi:hypothetical protein